MTIDWMTLINWVANAVIVGGTGALFGYYLGMKRDKAEWNRKVLEMILNQRHERELTQMELRAKFLYDKELLRFTHEQREMDQDAEAKEHEAEKTRLELVRGLDNPEVFAQSLRVALKLLRNRDDERQEARHRMESSQETLLPVEGQIVRISYLPLVGIVLILVAILVKLAIIAPQ